jgi:RAD50-interacting protein 1
VEFAKALIQLVLEKLHSELPVLEQDDALFAHALDETLSFDRELRSGLGYPIGQPGVIGVLTQAPVFIKWIAMERKCNVFQNFKSGIKPPAQFQMLVSEWTEL